MMKGLADKYNVASVQELLETAQDMGVKLWPCQMTMDLMGLKEDDLIDGLGAPVGAAAAVAEMQKSSINLFI
jgi:peroxiredoxin family protein